VEFAATNGLVKVKIRRLWVKNSLGPISAVNISRSECSRYSVDRSTVGLTVSLSATIIIYHIILELTQHLDIEHAISAFWATVCKTVRAMLSDRYPVLFVCL